MDEIRIEPPDIREGVPISVFLSADTAGPSLRVHALLPALGTDFTVPVNPWGDKRIAQFTLYRAGDYEVSVSGVRSIVHVAPQQNLSFFSEFGLFSVSVLILVGGMLVWLKKRSSKQVKGRVNLT